LVKLRRTYGAIFGGHHVLPKTVLGLHFCRLYEYNFNHFDIIGPYMYWNWWNSVKSRPLSWSRSFKVTTAKFDVKKLQTSFYGMVQNIFRYLEPFRRGSRVWQRQTWQLSWLMC